MTKVRKQKRRKKFRYTVNRKKLRVKHRKLPSIQCLPVKDAWEVTRSVGQNLKDMGLVYDINKSIRIPTAKESLLPADAVSEMECQVIPTKKHVVEAIEAEVKKPRVKKFRLPDGQVRWLTYLLDKYGEDYKAMVKDSKNHYQETWKQIRRKIDRFKTIPEQYNAYLESKKPEGRCMTTLYIFK
ncbi:hypothetical protein L9F63_012496, partial [Diploptera punctata]